MTARGRQRVNPSSSIYPSLATSTAAPYQTLWETSVSGRYTIEVRATDKFGQLVTASRVVGISAPPPNTDTISRDGTNLGKGVVTFFHQDLRGNNIAATDAMGVVLWQEAYYPFGERIAVPVQAGSYGQWFQSKPVDTDTGLSYFGSRYYDPTVGRFYEIDPQVYSEGNVHSFNRYAYANNNPLKYTDPDGHSPVDLAFLAYDVYNLGKTIYQGGVVGGALLDVGICTAYFCR